MKSEDSGREDKTWGRERERRRDNGRHRVFQHGGEGGGRIGRDYEKDKNTKITQNNIKVIKYCGKEKNTKIMQ